jgi:uncharacterized protein with PIN domain
MSEREPEPMSEEDRPLSEDELESIDAMIEGEGRALLECEELDVLDVIRMRTTIRARDETIERLQRKASNLEMQAAIQAQEQRTANSQVREVARALGCESWEVTGTRAVDAMAPNARLSARVEELEQVLRSCDETDASSWWRTQRHAALSIEEEK